MLYNLYGAGLVEGDIDMFIDELSLRDETERLSLVEEQGEA